MGWLFSYPLWLAGLSLLFVAAERIWPRRANQRLLRRGIWTDLFYLIFNAEYLGMAIGIASASLLGWLNPAWLQRNLLSDAPFWMQLGVWFVALDFAQW